MANQGRHPVAQGGMWSTPKVQYSQATQQMLKEMMQESKLTNFQQRQLRGAMQEGSALPVNVNPTSSGPKRPSPVTKTNKNSKVLNPRNHSNNIRTRDAIEASGAYKRDQYIPKPLTHYDKDKERLANIMAFGEDIDPMMMQKKPAAPPPPAPEVDRFDELEQEIEERRAFLSDMEALGQGDKYRTIIDTEISQKIREMEVIDKKRTAELERAIAADKKKQSSNIPKPDV